MKESSLWNKVRKYSRAWGRVDRIENLAGTGQFDVNYCIDGREGWIELKVWPRKYRPSQAEFARQQYDNRGIAYVLVQVDKNVYLLRAMDYLQICEAPRMDRRVLEQLYVWRLKGSSWDMLRVYMTSRLHAGVANRNRGKA